ncbi:MAG: SH3 domain-containing protein [Anaerolineae bacterium]
MSLDNKRRVPGSSSSGQDLWPKWMWVAVPVLVVVVVAGLWWAIFSPSDAASAGPTATPTMKLAGTQPTQGPTLFATLPALEATATREILPLSTFTPTPGAVTTPTGEVVEEVVGLAVGVKAVVDTGGQGLNVRTAAGTGQSRIKTLPDGTSVEIIGGPKDADSLTWWEIRDETGSTGWVAAKFLKEAE